MTEKTDKVIRITKQLSRILEMPDNQFESVVKLMKDDRDPAMQEFGIWLSEIREEE